MGEAAPTGWLGVGRPYGPPVPWPRAKHRALPAPGRGFGSPTPRGVPSTVFGALDAGAAPRSAPAGSGWGALFVSEDRRDPAFKKSSSTRAPVFPPLAGPSLEKYV